MAGPSVGDILLCSQTAWKIGRAFTAGRTGAPLPFHQAEAEINGLAKALKQLAEAMFADEDSLLEQTDRETQIGFATITGLCRATVLDLDSLLEQYQVTKKTRTQGGFTIDRSWSDLVLTQYQTMMWTSDGGSLDDLRRLLHMYTATITSTREALQSKSATRLQAVIPPLAEQIGNLHQISGDRGKQLDEATQVATQIAQLSLQPTPEQVARAPEFQASRASPYTKPKPTAALDIFPSPYLNRSDHYYSPNAPSAVPGSPDMATTIAASPTASTFTSPTIVAGKRISGFSFGGQRNPRYSESYASSDGESSHDPSAVSRRIATLSRQSSLRASDNGTHPALREPRSRPDSSVLAPSMLPPPAMTLPPHRELDAQSISTMSLQSRDHAEDVKKLHRSSLTTNQKDNFERLAFRNSAILCDVRGTLVEYAQRLSSDAASYDVDMVQACANCRIAVVRKREAAADARRDIRMMTSIWVFDDDNTMRLELKLADGEMYVPYSSYFSPEKVSVTVPCELKYHDVQYGQRVLNTVKTSWINYIFDSTHAAALFQNELMGRTLLATYRTTKTLRVHSGLSRSFAYAEQMCGLENLRIWEDNDTLAVIALVHFSPQFRQGYLAFYLNSKEAPITVKDVDAREVKIKGLRVPVGDAGGKGLAGAGSASRKDSLMPGAGGGPEKDRDSGGKDKEKDKKMVTGARIEFSSEAEKRAFLALVDELQSEMRQLPELAGVN